MISRNRRRNGKAHSRRKDGEEGAGLSPSAAIEFATEELLSLRHCILRAPVLARFHYRLSHRAVQIAHVSPSRIPMSVSRCWARGTAEGGGRRNSFRPVARRRRRHGYCAQNRFCTLAGFLSPHIVQKRQDFSEALESAKLDSLSPPVANVISPLCSDLFFATLIPRHPPTSPGAISRYLSVTVTLSRRRSILRVPHCC